MQPPERLDYVLENIYIDYGAQWESIGAFINRN